MLNIRLLLKRISRKFKNNNRIYLDSLEEEISQYITDNFPVNFIREYNLNRYNSIRLILIKMIYKDLNDLLNIRQPSLMKKYIDRKEIDSLLSYYDAIIIRRIYHITDDYIDCNRIIDNVRTDDMIKIQKRLIKILKLKVDVDGNKAIIKISKMILSMFINGMCNDYDEIIYSYKFELESIYSYYTRGWRE